jgi:hypothetical protein
VYGLGQEKPPTAYQLFVLVQIPPGERPSVGALSQIIFPFTPLVGADVVLQALKISSLNN